MEREVGCDVGKDLDSGHGVGNGLDSGQGVDNGLDRGRVDVVVDIVLLLKVTPRWNTSLVVSSNIVLAVKRGAANTITKWAIALGHQQGTRPCQTPGIIQ